MIVSLALNLLYVICLTYVACDDLHHSSSDKTGSRSDLIENYDYHRKLSITETRHHLYFFYFGLLTVACNTLLGLVASIGMSQSLSCAYIVSALACDIFNLIGAAQGAENRVAGYKVLIHAPDMLILIPAFSAYAVFTKHYQD